MRAISRIGWGGASACAVLLLACGPPRASESANGGPPAPRPLPPRPLSEVFVLEAAGAQPEDTTVRIDTGTPKVIVLRRSAPDFGLFARIELDDSTLRAAADTAAAVLTIRPRPGEYGLELELPRGAVGSGGTILFSYGSHFVAPAGARERYGSDIYFERELAIGRVDANGQVVFLPTSRPGSDMLSAPLPGPGHYLVAAPR